MERIDELCYMDHAATTPMRREVVDAMLPWLTDYCGNATSAHRLGEQSEEAVEAARARVARLLAAQADEIYFTSGGTESDNWAIKGSALEARARGDHIITTSIEHPAILESCRYLEGQSLCVTYLPVDSWGTASPEAVQNAITEQTILVSVMHANNEVGTIQPVEEVGRVVKGRGIIFHVDAVQTAGRIPVDVNAIGCDLLSISAHKFNGPKGVGALYVRRGTRLATFMHGGEQERNLRAGTHNVPGIVGMGEAAVLAQAEAAVDAKRTQRLRERMEKGILARVPGIRVNGHPTRRLPGTLSICVTDADAESLILALSLRGICVSSGSACTSGSLEPSHVLVAMGVPANEALGALRFTLGAENTETEIDHVLDVLPRVVEKLRRTVR